MGSLLVVDDDPHIRELVAALLDQAGFAVAQAADGHEGLRLLGQEAVDACVVDVMMPKVDGLMFAEAVRRYYPDLPVLLLTAKGQLGDKVRGFAAGADDYLVKPFEGPELVARVKALLRRYHKVVEQTAQAGTVVLDADSHVVTVDGAPVELPLKEFDLLFTLASHKGRTLTRRQIIDEVWGLDFEGNERTLDVHVNRLRERFGLDHGFQLKTVRGLGYRLEDLP
ncbi:MAG: response regulator transcription factor [Propionibacteriaceae bacterium]|nr:response regulator transcription factor [Propionibacteriaceae bacterium]